MNKAPEARRMRLRALAAEAAAPDTSDAPEASAAAWAGAEIGKFFRPRKEVITMRVDADVLDWFRRSTPGGSGYQTAINAALRQHMAREGR